MKRFICFLANTIIFFSALWSGTGFLLYLGTFRRTQRKKLLSLYRKNRNTAFLKELRLKGHGGPHELPLTDWDDYESHIRQILRNKKNVLTKENVVLLEPTSGTTSPTKYIPYTRGLQKEFKRAIQPWLLGLYLTRPLLLFTSQYWSISPATAGKNDTGNPVPVGFEQDSQYLGGRLSRVMERIMTVPGRVKDITGYDAWARATVFFLVRDKYLGLISVWHPSFLIILIEKIRTGYSGIVSDIENGAITFGQGEGSFTPGPVVSGDIAAEPGPRWLADLDLKPDPVRARELRSIDKDKEDFFRQIWPRLKVISCWADDPQENGLVELKKMFPSIWIQPKGLIATEGIISFPFGKTSGLPAYRSHLLEFIDLRNNELKPLGKLELHRHYEPVISTGGGLYRYRMNDEVKVTGFYRGKLPLLQFLHKRDYISDIRGEKVSLQHVIEILDQVKAQWPGIMFLMLSPVVKANKAFYCCYINSGDDSKISPDQLAGLIDDSLGKNFHYHHARQIGQLTRPEIFLLEKDPVEDMVNYIESTGVKRGEIKLLPLSRHTIWAQILKGRFIN
jgi:hypothetical protein